MAADRQKKFNCVLSYVRVYILKIPQPDIPNVAIHLDYSVYIHDVYVLSHIYKSHSRGVS